MFISRRYGKSENIAKICRKIHTMSKCADKPLVTADCDLFSKEFAASPVRIQKGVFTDAGNRGMAYISASSPARKVS